MTKNYQKYIDMLSIKEKEKIEEYAQNKRFYLIYKLLIDKWL